MLGSAHLLVQEMHYPLGAQPEAKPNQMPELLATASQWNLVCLPFQVVQLDAKQHMLQVCLSAPCLSTRRPLHLALAKHMGVKVASLMPLVLP